MTNGSQGEKPERLEWREFLVDRPPYTVATIDPGASWHTSERLELETPDVEMHCSACKGLRMFDSDDEVRFYPNRIEPKFVVYKCKNCEQKPVRFAILFIADEAGPVTAIKIGQYPAYGPTTPPELLDLLDQDRELYLKGRRSESQGMGIGAFAYYRRAVENAKDRLFDQIIEIANKQEMPASIIEGLKQAKSSRQFGRGMDELKVALPTSLLIDGMHNPMQLLHSALSRSVHQESDQQCLELAIHVRKVLFDMAERIAHARRDHSDLRQSVAALMRQRPAAT